MKPREYVHAMVRLIDEGHTPKDVVASLRGLLTERHAMHVLNDILRSLSQEIDHGHHDGVIRIETAHATSEKTLRDIRDALTIPEGSRVIHVVDENHIGGFRVLYDYTLTDMTLETRLRNLHKRLLAASGSTS